MTGKFQPAPWCRGGHAQTIIGGIFRENLSIPYRRERLELPDGDFLDLDWADAAPLASDAPLVFILHGLASHSSSLYIKTLIDEILKRGWRAVVMNARGQSGEPNRLNVTHHAGRSQDLDFALKHTVRVSKAEKIYPVGFSLGANLLLKWLGENPAQIPSQIKKAVGVSGSYDLLKTSTALDTNGFNRNIYVRSMLNYLKPLAYEKEARFPGSLNLPAIQAASTFKVYDREVTAKLNGFKDEMDYWEKSSAMNYAAQIQTPTLIIHAANDPFLPEKDFPHAKLTQSPHVKILMTQDGGHLGFVSGKWPWESGRWLEKTIFMALNETL